MIQLNLSDGINKLKKQETIDRLVEVMIEIIDRILDRILSGNNSFNENKKRIATAIFVRFIKKIWRRIEELPKKDDPKYVERTLDIIAGDDSWNK